MLEDYRRIGLGIKNAKKYGISIRSLLVRSSDIITFALIMTAVSSTLILFVPLADPNAHISNQNNIIPAAYADYLSQFGSTGIGNGQFRYPSGIAIDGSGNIYVTDEKNNRTEEFDSDGVYKSKFGFLGLGPGQFQIPAGIAFDRSGNIYVADDGNSRIDKFDPAGTFQGWIGGCSSGTNCDTSNYVTKRFCSDCVLYGPFTPNLLFFGPTAIALDRSGNIYVVDYDGPAVEKFDPAGTFQGWIGGCSSGTNCDTSNHVTTGFCSDCRGFTGSGAGQFSSTFGITIDGSGNIYVADDGNGRVEKFDPAGTFQGWIGGCSSGTNCDTSNHVTTGFCSDCVVLGPGSGPGQFGNFGGGIALDSSGNIYVADTLNNRVEEFNSAGTYQSEFGSHGFGDGQFNSPTDIAVDSSSNIYVTDSLNDRVEKFSPMPSTVPEFPAAIVGLVAAIMIGAVVVLQRTKIIPSGIWSSKF